MIQWDYQITLHEIPEPKIEKQSHTIECDQNGQCFVHDALLGGLEWLEDLFREKGRNGWELVQSGYHHRELLCIWKKKKQARTKV
ncbi:MAG: hypothetical protein HXY44_15850 [Syntrophaceae bacterium]|nr:hypothetical protein [Syntrophaceae bacterium]